ncbi:hypothetical protein [Sphaerospermopsis sp. LEGE 08334]|nr:hypothetical protein [Sphaerospermopsis sp. LEGE 08334]MBE9059229.1 hypothetical protein [Sphaerospermopsis sp. LEGE 08334]
MQCVSEAYRRYRFLGVWVVRCVSEAYRRYRISGMWVMGAIAALFTN